MKLVRLALREPKDGALEAREAKFISVALAPALCRTGVGIFEAKSRPDGGVGWMAPPPLRYAVQGFAALRRQESKWAGEKEPQEGVNNRSQ
jgi:hypothetical protein